MLFHKVSLPAGGEDKAQIVTVFLPGLFCDKAELYRQSGKRRVLAQPCPLAEKLPLFPSLFPRQPDEPFDFVCW